VLKTVRSPRLSAPPLLRGAGGIERAIYLRFNYNQLLSVTNAIINPDFTNTVGNILNDDGPLPLGVSSSIHQDSLINNNAGNISPVLRQSTSGFQTNTNLGNIINGQNSDIYSTIDANLFTNSHPLDIFTPNNQDTINLSLNQSAFF